MTNILTFGNLCLLWTVDGGRVSTKPDKSSFVFGKSWCDMSVLGSQLFGQALMESCDVYTE